MKVATFCYSWDAFHMHAFPLEPKLEATMVKKAGKFECICAESVKVALLVQNSIHTGKTIIMIHILIKIINLPRTLSASMGFVQGKHVMPIDY